VEVKEAAEEGEGLELLRMNLSDAGLLCLSGLILCMQGLLKDMESMLRWISIERCNPMSGCLNCVQHPVDPFPLSTAWVMAVGRERHCGGARARPSIIRARTLEVLGREATGFVAPWV